MKDDDSQSSLKYKLLLLMFLVVLFFLVILFCYQQYNKSAVNDTTKTKPLIKNKVDTLKITFPQKDNVFIEIEPTTYRVIRIQLFEGKIFQFDQNNRLILPYEDKKPFLLDPNKTTQSFTSESVLASESFFEKNGIISFIIDVKTKTLQELTIYEKKKKNVINYDIRSGQALTKTIFFDKNNFIEYDLKKNKIQKISFQKEGKEPFVVHVNEKNEVIYENDPDYVKEITENNLKSKVIISSTFFPAKKTNPLLKEEEIEEEIECEINQNNNKLTKFINPVETITLDEETGSELKREFFCNKNFGTIIIERNIKNNAISSIKTIMSDPFDLEGKDTIFSWTLDQQNKLIFMDQEKETKLKSRDSEETKWIFELPCEKNFMIDPKTRSILFSQNLMEQRKIKLDYSCYHSSFENVFLFTIF
ncbi:hypothetical protein [Vaccinium witches'-broom phytoplasma]|uniref:hypothetical protein n=1 Tax=Vaccinium witches'-broom phytoplasma TaxID=85642 RepID=UPI00035F786C|nr:hypothetical protein [Vaccinium witches'-broom phytoplasma]